MHDRVSEGKAVRVTPQEGAPGKRGGPRSWDLSWGELVRKVHQRRSRLPGERGACCPWLAPAHVASGFSRLDRLGHQGQGKKPGQRLRLREGTHLAGLGRRGRTWSSMRIQWSWDWGHSGSAWSGYHGKGRRSWCRLAGPTEGYGSSLGDVGDGQRTVVKCGLIRMAGCSRRT